VTIGGEKKKNRNKRLFDWLDYFFITDLTKMAPQIGPFTPVVDET